VLQAWQSSNRISLDALITEIVAITNRAARQKDLLEPVWAGATLLALEDGFRLHRLIDPETTPADSFLRTVSELQRIIGLGQSHKP
jgi:hypothetical protein